MSSSHLCPQSCNISKLISCEHWRVTGTTRFRELPDVPTAGDFVSGYDANYWIGLGAPKKTPNRHEAQQGNQCSSRDARYAVAVCTARGHCGRWFALRL